MALTKVIGTGIGSIGATTVTGEGTATTSLQQGLCKVWADVDMTGTAAVDDSFNVTGITDNGTGDVTVTIANDMGNATYACSSMCGAVSSFDDEGSAHIISRATGTARFGITDVHNAADAVDIDPCMFIIHGDLA